MNKLEEQFDDILNDLYGCVPTYFESTDTIRTIYQAMQKAYNLGRGIIPDLMCECGGNNRVAEDCTSKKCKHPNYQ